MMTEMNNKEATMKLSKSKLALAKVINENGGWVDCEAIFAAMDGNGNLFGYSGKPQWAVSRGYWYGHTLTCWFFSPVVMKNYHQTILSREEYYQAYPKADADGWIEWNGGECPVGDGVLIDVKKVDGSAELAVHDPQDRIWGDTDHRKCIIACRLHKPEAKPEFCESVMRSIPEPESHEKLSPEAIEDAKFALMSESIEESKRKPTIEQLAQDYRNAKGYADRLQKEAGEAAAKAEEFAVEIRKKLLELQELIGIPNPEKEHELEITDWRDLMVGDEVECTKYATAYRFGVVCRIDESSEEQPIMVNHGDGNGTSWPSSWKFIRRP